MHKTPPLVLQWNIRSIKKNRHDLLILVNETNPFCICLNETFLGNPINFSIKSHSSYHTGSDNQRGNLIFIRKDIPFTPFNCRTDLNALAVRLKVDNLITICSIYLNPNERINVDKLKDLISQLPQPFFLVGDFNARNTFWYDTKCNPRGNVILDTILNKQLHILDGRSPTHYDQRTKSYSHIDLTLCTQDLASTYFWSTNDDRCGSDHFPIFIKPLNFTFEPPRKRFN